MKREKFVNFTRKHFIKNFYTFFYSGTLWPYKFLSKVIANKLWKHHFINIYIYTDLALISAFCNTKNIYINWKGTFVPIIYSLWKFNDVLYSDANELTFYRVNEFQVRCIDLMTLLKFHNVEEITSRMSNPVPAYCFSFFYYYYFFCNASYISYFIFIVNWYNPLVHIIIE